jgi:hypothetical protein
LHRPNVSFNWVKHDSSAQKNKVTGRAIGKLGPKARTETDSMTEKYSKHSSREKATLVVRKFVKNRPDSKQE